MPKADLPAEFASALRHRPILGFDVGGTKTAVVLGSRDGAVQARRQIASPLHLGPHAMIDAMVELARELLRDAAAPEVEAAGVSIGGPLDSEAGVILGPPHLPGWDEVPLREMLEARLHVPVFVEHDARTGALAEWRFGAGLRSDGSSVDNLIFLTLGTGLGAGIIAGGRLLHGRSSRTAEAGHWRIAPDGPEMFGKRGSWESYCSGAGIAALAAWRYPRRFSEVNVERLAQLARAGDAEARAVFAESAEKLGQGIALLCDLFVPDVVALGALGIRLRDLLLPTVEAVVRAEALPAVARRCHIVPVALGERIGDVAALCAALYRLEHWDDDGSTNS
jgi:glucokinase